MTITLCNSHPFTFYLPFHTSLRADQCPIQSHVPSTCTLGLDPCARHSLFGRTDPYYIDNFYSSCGLKRLAATLASPLLCNCTVLPVPLSTGPYLDMCYHWIFFQGTWDASDRKHIKVSRENCYQHSAVCDEMTILCKTLQGRTFPTRLINVAQSFLRQSLVFCVRLLVIV